MGDVILVDVLDSKVVDHEGETDWAPVVCPISWGKFALFVAGVAESFLEEFLRDYSCLGGVRTFLIVPRRTRYRWHLLCRADCIPR